LVAAGGRAIDISDEKSSQSICSNSVVLKRDW